MNKIIKIVLKIIALLIIGLIFFYIFFVIPNDKRTEIMPVNVKKIDVKEDLVFDFSKEMLPENIKTPLSAAEEKLIADYPYKQNAHGQHYNPFNMHISLGWFPMKTVHRDCIYAPAPYEMEFELIMPQKPVLKFDYAIAASTIPVEFIVNITDENNNSKDIFTKTETPMKHFSWKYYDSYYKNFYKYFHPRIEGREGRWNFESIGLTEFAGKKVKIKFITKSNSDGSTLSFWGQPCLYNQSAAQKSPNVLLVVVDSFRADAINETLAPNLYSFAQEGINFKNALSNGNMTKLSVYSFLTSRYPFEIPEAATHYDLSPKDKENFYQRRIPTLPSVMKSNGYRTAAIGSVSLFCDGHGLSADLGFDESENLEHSGYSPVHVTQEGINWLNKHGAEKFFLMLYYDGPHGPYRPPLKYLFKTIWRQGGLKNFRKLLYNGEIVYHDTYIGYLKEYLKSSGLADNTIIIFTSDHGVAFRQETYNWPVKFGSWKKKKVRFHSHGVSVTPDDLNVPLIFFNTGRKKIIDTQVQLLDLAPTIANFAGCSVPADFHGKSLVPLINGELFDEPVSFHQGWLNYGVYLNNEYLYIHNNAPREGFPKETLIPEELYNIKQDRKCRNNIALTDSQLLRKMRSLLRSFVHPENEYRIKYIGKKGSCKITIKANGIIKNNNAKLINNNKSIAEFELLPEEAVSFVVEPAETTISISGLIDGRQIKCDDILAGENALPLLDSLVIKPQDMVYFSGWPEKIDKNCKQPILFGIIEKQAKSDEDLKKSPKQLKSMLEQWGYIN